jgi:hypothetical protein
MRVRKRTPAIQVLLVVSSERRLKILADATGRLSEPAPQPNAKPKERKLVVEGRRPPIERRARGVPLLSPGLKSVRPADVKPIKWLGVGGWGQHLGERPGVVRQHGRPHFHRKEGRVEAASPLLDAALAINGRPLQQPTRRR